MRIIEAPLSFRKFNNGKSLGSDDTWTQSIVRGPTMNLYVPGSDI